MNQTETIQAGYRGLYCKACTIYIGTKDYLARLAILASKFGISEEEMKCFGCRSDTKRYTAENANLQPAHTYG